VDEESKWKSHEYEVRAAQEAWQRVGYVPESVAAPLAARFQRAVQRFYGDRKGGAPAHAPAPRGRK
jgi:predicted transcriptional regulator of viral defense system